jgi:hypothetical protein
VSEEVSIMTAATLEPRYSTAQPAVRPVPASGLSKSVVRLGFWSAALTAVFGIWFIIGGVLGMVAALPPPWDVALPIAPSLLLAPVFVVMMVALHYAAPEDKRVWSHIGIVFAVLYAALVSIVYVTWLFVVEPHVLRGEADQVAPFLFAPGSFAQMVDGLGYTFMGLATLFAAPVFAGRGLAAWLRGLFFANGALSALVFIAYVVYSTALGAPWALVFPAVPILLAVYFRRAGRDTA